MFSQLGTHLPDFLEQHAAGTSEHENSRSEEVLKPVSTLLRKYTPDARRLAAERVIRSQLPREIYQFGFVFLAGEKMGKHYKAIPMTPEIQQWLMDGDAVLSREWEALAMKVKLSLESMAMCLDHFRVEVMKKNGYKAIMPVLGCAGCGAAAVVDDQGRAADLLRCDRCRMAFYCGVECQRAHWPEHKAECKKWKSGAASTSNNVEYEVCNSSNSRSSSSNKSSSSGSSSDGDCYQEERRSADQQKRTLQVAKATAAAGVKGAKGGKPVTSATTILLWLLLVALLLGAVAMLLTHFNAFAL